VDKPLPNTTDPVAKRNLLLLSIVTTSCNIRSLSVSRIRWSSNSAAGVHEGEGDEEDEASSVRMLNANE
jgi:hypothetical protein